MIRMKRWAAVLLAAILWAGTLTGCGKKEEELTLSVCAGESVETFDPAYVSSSAENTVVGNLYENLMRLTCDVNGVTTVTEGMAKRVNVEENFDGTQTYTFYLRNARWSDGKEVKADDFVYAWRRLADPRTLSPNASLLSVVQGYQAVRDGEDPSKLAVNAKNETTLEVILTGKYEWFLSDVCTAPATSPLRQDVVQTLKEAGQAAIKSEPEGTAPLKWWHDPVQLVTNGAYQAFGYEAGTSLDLKRNENYYGSTGNDGLHVVFAENSEDAWALYEAKEVDFVNELPTEQIQELQDGGQWSATPNLATYTVLFNAAQHPFDDPALRKALSLAVDRQELSKLAGVTALPAQGLVPYGVPGDKKEDFRTAGGDLLAVKVEDYQESCKLAKDLLLQSSYKNGEQLEYLYVDEGTAGQVAQELANQWGTVLDVQIRLRAVSKEELQAALKNGEYSLAAISAAATVNDAEAFLMPFTTRSPENVVSYASGVYDTLMSIIDSASDNAARLACMHDAEALLLDDNVVCPLYFDGTAWKLRERYTGLCRDARGWFIFSGITVVS